MRPWAVHLILLSLFHSTAPQKHFPMQIRSMILHKIALKTCKQDGKVQGPPSPGILYFLWPKAICTQPARCQRGAGSGILLDNAIRTTFTLLRLLPLLTLDCKRKRGWGGAGYTGNSFRIIPIDELSLLFIIIPAYAARCPEKDVGM